MTPLCELGAKFKTDKYQPHNYTTIYHHLLAERAHTVRRVLEIGVRWGGSLRMWEAFFPHAEIVGIDRHPGYLFQAGRIKTYCGNQAKPAKLAKLVKGLGRQPFDLIVDDGSHQTQKQINALRALLPFLKYDGFYFIEDICGDGDVALIQSRLPRGFLSYVHLSDKPHPKHGREKMLIIWRPKFITPSFLTEKT